MKHSNILEYAQDLDRKDELNQFRKKFHFPQFNEKDVLYFCGNSLGLQPKNVKDYVMQELEDWAQHGVEGHFKAKKAWFSYHEFLSESAAQIVGALPSEVVVMNQLTLNLHLLMVSFYRPTKERYKIICEAKAFPSDQYAIETQVLYHGLDPATSVIEVAPREGEHVLRHEDIIKTIEANKDSLALILLGGVNYYSGQVFDMESITQAAHDVGAYAGFDLAHAAGNLKLELHDWNIDFACWCSYKYLNSGPGGVAGAFVHERHGKNFHLPRFGGWWGHDKEKRFLMEKGFVPMHGAEGWQLSNAPVLSMAAHRASLDVFDEAGMDKLVAKSKTLTNYLDFIITDVNQDSKSKLEIITPANERGCQLSIVSHGKGKELFYQLHDNGVISDWREPNVIRLAPVPLYNSFEDIYQFGVILKQLLNN